MTEWSVIWVIRKQCWFDPLFQYSFAIILKHLRVFTVAKVDPNSILHSLRRRIPQTALETTHEMFEDLWNDECEVTDRMLVLVFAL